MEVDYSWKIRSDFEIKRIEDLTNQLLDDSRFKSISFIDWVLHKGGYPMDFIQFGSTEDCLEMWRGVRTWSFSRVPEKKLNESFVRIWSKRNEDRNAHKSMSFFATKLLDLEGSDLIWHKIKVTLRGNWMGNPVFVQLSAHEAPPDSHE